MNVSQKRIDANIRNAARSTGPKTALGKSKSRSNSLKHGLAAEVLRTPDEEQALQARGIAVGADGALTVGEWLQGEVAVLTMRIDRTHQTEDRERDRASARAATCWDEDRRREADRIGAGLARRPDRVVPRLRETPQGCAWLIERWTLLRDSAVQDGGWNPTQRRMALDLRGLPDPFRSENALGSDHAALAIREIGVLNRLRDALRGSDAFDRESVRLGLGDEGVLELRRLRRYEASLHRRLRWCLEQLDPNKAKTTKRPRPAARPAPVEVAEVADAPEPNEPTAVPPVAAPAPVPVSIPVSVQNEPISRSRRDPRLLREQSRRDEKRLKQERRRA